MFQFKELVRDTKTAGIFIPKFDYILLASKKYLCVVAKGQERRLAQGDSEGRLANAKTFFP